MTTLYNVRLGDDWSVTTDDGELADRRRREGYDVATANGGDGQ